MAKSRHKGIGSSWLCFCSLVPWILLLVVISLSLHLRVGLGHWAHSTWDHYDSAAFSFHSALGVLFLLSSLFLALPTWGAFIWIGSGKLLGARLLLPMVYLSGCASIVLTFLYAPNLVSYVFYGLD